MWLTGQEDTGSQALGATKCLSPRIRYAYQVQRCKSSHLNAT